MEKIRFAVIGLGCRGGPIIKKVLLKMPDVEIVSVCDHFADRVEEYQEYILAETGKRPLGFTDHYTCLQHGGIDAVYVATTWETHVEVAIDAMKLGIPVALEVGGAYCVERMWDMVHTYEQTRTPLMFMENCCYGKQELLATSLVRHGILGDIVHAHGAYGHYLAPGIANGVASRHYRLRNYLNRNCENYPTHELGPIAKVLNINRGNQMVSLVSVASRAVGVQDYVMRHQEQFPHLVGKQFRQGDIVNTIITCADGSTISMRLDTTLPRHYSREFNLHGTRGLYEMNTNMVFLDGGMETYQPVEYYKASFNNASEYEEQYLPRCWKGLTDEQKKVGHGGMDGVMFRSFVDDLRAGKAMTIDVYDAASWMVVTALSEASVAAGGAPQAIPDFTGGMWTVRQPLDVVEWD